MAEMQAEIDVRVPTERIEEAVVSAGRDGLTDDQLYNLGEEIWHPDDARERTRSTIGWLVLDEAIVAKNGVYYAA